VTALIEKTIDGEELSHFQEVVRRVPVPDHTYDFVVDLVRRSRPGTEASPEWIRNLVTWGAGPRAVQYLIIGAKARAALQGSYLVRIEDIEALAEPVLVHRILTSFHAESEGISSRDIIKRLLEEARTDARV
jgi:MoxR-like ATPase